MTNPNPKAVTIPFHKIPAPLQRIILSSESRGATVVEMLVELTQLRLDAASTEQLSRELDQEDTLKSLKKDLATSIKTIESLRATNKQLGAENEDCRKVIREQQALADETSRKSLEQSCADREALSHAIALINYLDDN